MTAMPKDRCFLVWVPPVGRDTVPGAWYPARWNKHLNKYIFGSGMPVRADSAWMEMPPAPEDKP